MTRPSLGFEDDVDATVAPDPVLDLSDFQPTPLSVPTKPPCAGS